MFNAIDHVELIREVFRYAQAFQGKTFVLQLDDAIVLRSTVVSLMRDLVLLHRTGIRIVLVAGARQRIDEILQRYNVDCEKHGGVRISTPDAIPFIKMAAFDAANRVMTSLSGQGVNAVIGNWVRARSLGVVDGIDFQDAGTVDKIRVDLLRGVIEQGSIPILPCIGWSGSGKPYNISSRELATELATALQASKLFFLAELDPLTTSRYQVAGDVDSTPGGRISRLTVEQATRFVDLNRDREDDLGCELVGRGLRAARHGVERVHIVDGRSEGVVLQEIFSNLGVGTMVHANQYQSIRSMTRADVPDVYRLMQPLVQRGLLVQRTEGDLHDSIDDYVVFETDGMVHGCGALHIYNERQAEVAGLAVDDNYEHFGIGQRIVRFLIEGARRAGLRELFVLTTQASDWFEQLGFRAGSVEDMPKSKRERYDYARNSRVMLYEIGETDEAVSSLASE
ncbi:MAG TPA: amino-acid N-acetyltransferase [Spirochaetia bacterium]|nr:amino-acid N-acetyltransferase [Spirochaetia bacterium]